MGTVLTDAINALVTYSNSVTGASDTTLSEAIATLAAGYQGGGTGTITYPAVNGMPLTAAINALIAYSNQVTGASDTTASEAVATLVAGYGGGGRLPDAYQEVEWIGTKVKASNKLMTGVTPKAPVRIVTEYYFVSSGWRALLDVTSAPYNIRYVESNGTGYYNWGNKQFGFTSPAYNTWHTLDASSTLIIDGVTIGAISGGTSDWTGNATEYYFLQTNNSCIARVKETFIYTGNTLEADLVPCYRKSDSHIGWYDIVNDTFFGFADNSKAEKGNDV